MAFRAGGLPRLNPLARTHAYKGDLLSAHIWEARLDMVLPWPERREQRTKQHGFYVSMIQPLLEAVLDSEILSIETKIAGLNALLSNWNNKSALQMAVKLLDQMFFSGELSAHIDVHFTPLPDRRGRCKRQEYTSGQPYILIEVDHFKIKSEKHLRETMVHEMMHAYVRLHACRCGDTSCEASFRSLRQCGISGHGWYWQRLAEEAEKLAEEIWGEPFDVGRAQHALIELTRSADLYQERWGVPYDIGRRRETLTEEELNSLYIKGIVHPRAFVCGCFLEPESINILEEWTEHVEELMLQAE